MLKVCFALFKLCLLIGVGAVGYFIYLKDKGPNLTTNRKREDTESIKTRFKRRQINSKNDLKTEQEMLSQR